MKSVAAQPILTSPDGTLSLGGEWRVPWPDEDNQFMLPWVPDLHGTCVGFRFPDGGEFGVDGMSVFKVTHPSSGKLNLHEILVLGMNMGPDGRIGYPLRRHHCPAGGSGVRTWSLPMGSVVIKPNGIFGLWGNGWMDVAGRGWNFDGNPFETSAVLLGKPGVRFQPVTPAVMAATMVKADSEAEWQRMARRVPAAVMKRCRAFRQAEARKTKGRA